ncbi:hypothetical protein CI109_104449 [Kwoniella shandongensis]|uniref:C2H2-type domain-containing protein n=1 Tax=Kwoniella shandongensis TaxID=1734106 RepID=A0AAJ8MYP7_9TREE
MTTNSPAATAAKVFRCSEPGCVKAFGRRDYLERHAANHSPSKQHVCPLCEKSYARADVLKRHMQNHPRPRSNDKQDTPASSRGGTSVATESAIPVAADQQGSTSGPGMDALLNINDMLRVNAVPSMDLSSSIDFPPTNDLYTWLLGADATLSTEPPQAAAEPSNTFDWATSFGLNSAGPSTSEPGRVITTESWQGVKTFVQDLGAEFPSQGFTEHDFQRYFELFYL